MKFQESTKSSQLNNWGNLLLVIGLLSLLSFGYLIYQRYNPQNLSFAIKTSEPSSNNQSALEPQTLKINSINLALTVTASEIKNNKWEASTKGVSHLKSSVLPGEKGNAILYGHNWPNLLGNLKNTRPGDKITIIYNDNSQKNFEVEYLTKVSSNETSILENSEDNRITLYTCTGFLDTQRLVVVAKLVNS